MPREVGSEGVDNISGIAWDDINKVNAIEKASIDKFSGYQTGQEFVWGQQDGVYLFTSFQREPTDDWSSTSDESGAPTNDEANPDYGNYPIDNQNSEVGNTIHSLGKTNSGGTTDWLNGQDLYKSTTGNTYLISRDSDKDTTITGYFNHGNNEIGDIISGSNLYYEGSPISSQTSDNDNLADTTAWDQIAFSSNGWNFGFPGSTYSGRTGFVDGGSGLSTFESRHDSIKF